jgi:hypothetical protein
MEEKWKVLFMVFLIHVLLCIIISIPVILWAIYKMDIPIDEYYILDDLGIKYEWGVSNKLDVSFINRIKYFYKDTKYRYLNNKERR